MLDNYLCWIIEDFIFMESQEIISASLKTLCIKVDKVMYLVFKISKIKTMKKTNGSYTS